MKSEFITDEHGHRYEINHTRDPLDGRPIRGRVRLVRDAAELRPPAMPDNSLLGRISRALACKADISDFLNINERSDARRK